ncbi:MAG: Rubrerythrin [Candidatus Altiarchaeales archaeon]|nr:Rubrerythrin [Candidatus Altiarchaeales archaeon]
MEGGQHKNAIDFSSIAPVLTPEEKMDDRELARALRLAIAAEHDAAHLYELMADASTHALAKKVLQDVSDEEKVHIGEFQKVLSELDEANEKSLEDGMEEVEDMSPGNEIPQE